MSRTAGWKIRRRWPMEFHFGQPGASDETTTTGNFTGDFSQETGTAWLENDNAAVHNGMVSNSGNAIIVLDTSGREAWGYIRGELSQAFGSELLTNGLLDNWTAGDPDNWTISGNDANRDIVEETTEVVSGSSAEFSISDVHASAGLALQQSSVLTLGGYFKLECQRKRTAFTGGSAWLSVGEVDSSTLSPGTDASFTTWNFSATPMTCQSVDITVSKDTSAATMYIDSASCKRITADGVRITNVRNGDGSRTWKYIDPNFDPNNIQRIRIYYL